MTTDQAAFEAGILPIDWRVEQLARVGSTNEEARRRALAGDPGRLWVVAREQTQGRGRQGRAWRSPPGNLYASALLIDPSPVELVAQIGFVAGVALCAAIDDFEPAVEVELKWPNDVVCGGAKLAGVLAEGTALRAGRLACVIGFGVNCESAPAGLPYPADYLSHALGQAVSPELLLARLARRFAEMLALWRGGAGFADIRARWLARAAGLGGPIRIAGAQGVREGMFETLDERGRLLLRRVAGVETIEAGDVFIIEGSGDGAAPTVSELRASAPPAGKALQG